MRMSLEFWDDTSGLDLQSSDFEAIVLVGAGNGMAPATPNYIDLGTSDPVPSGKTLSGTLYTFQIKLKGTTDAAKEVQRDTLSKWFKPNDFTFRKLIGYNIDDTNKDWYLEGYPVTPPMLQPSAVMNVYNVTLALKQPYWIENDLQTDTWNITGDTDTNQITSVGNIPALPTFTITPNTGKGSNSWAHKTFYAVHTSGYGMNGLPVDITAGGLDTATLVGAGKMQADGDDVRVLLNGVETERWFGTFNDASTKIWVTMNFTPAPHLKLAVALAGAGTPATIVVTYTDSVVTLPQNSTLQIGNELITYTSYIVDTVNKKITLTTSTREAKGSSIAAHNIADTVYWIENEVWLLYGNAAATAALGSDGKRPVIDPDLSSNALMHFEYFRGNFDIGSIEDAYFPMSFSATGQILQYTDISIHGNMYVDYAIVSGIYDSAGSWRNSTNIYLANLKIRNVNILGPNNFTRVAWGFFHAGGISNVAINGEKERKTSLPEWPTQVVVSNKSDGTGVVISDITSPSVINTPEPIAIDIATANYQNVYIMMTGEQAPMPTATVKITDAEFAIFDPPTITPMGVEQVNYTITGSLTNTDTGEIINFNSVSTKTGITLTINTDDQEVFNQDGKRVRGSIAFGGPKRDEWMTLIAGINDLAFSDPGTSDLTIVTTWRGRNTI